MPPSNTVLGTHDQSFAPYIIHSDALHCAGYAMTQLLPALIVLRDQYGMF